MRAQFPAGQVKLVVSAGRLKLYRRRLNQIAMYFVVYDGVTVHVGGRTHCMRMFNEYSGAIGAKMAEYTSEAWAS